MERGSGEEPNSDGKRNHGHQHFDHQARDALRPKTFSVFAGRSRRHHPQDQRAQHGKQRNSGAPASRGQRRDKADQRSDAEPKPGQSKRPWRKFVRSHRRDSRDHEQQINGAERDRSPPAMVGPTAFAKLVGDPLRHCRKRSFGGRLSLALQQLVGPPDLFAFGAFLAVRQQFTGQRLAELIENALTFRGHPFSQTPASSSRSRLYPRWARTLTADSLRSRAWAISAKERFWNRCITIASLCPSGS